MSDSHLNRREFLIRAAVLGLAASGMGTLVSACKSKGPLICTDVSSLAEEQRTLRTALRYVDSSARQDQFCRTCSQYTAAAESGTCGTCAIVPGSINPDGSCDSWTAAPQAGS